MRVGHHEAGEEGNHIGPCGRERFAFKKNVNNVFFDILALAGVKKTFASFIGCPKAAQGLSSVPTRQHPSLHDGFVCLVGIMPRCSPNWVWFGQRHEGWVEEP